MPLSYKRPPEARRTVSFHGDNAPGAVPALCAAVAPETATGNRLPAPIAGLEHLGLLTPEENDVIRYLDQAQENERHPPSLRYAAGFTSGNIFYKHSRFADVVLRFERVLPLLHPESSTPGDHAALLFHLANACHYAGDSRTAIRHLRDVRTLFEQIPDPLGVSSCLRVQCEIRNALGEYEPALTACTEALAIRRVLSTPPNSVADALFWKVSTLLRLHRIEEDAVNIQEALALWQDTRDQTGTGFCLRVLGKIRARQGFFAEARAHLDHAILLHERQNDWESRLAALEAKADIFFDEGRRQDALALYEECLAAYKAQYSRGNARLQDRIRASKLT